MVATEGPDMTYTPIDEVDLGAIPVGERRVFKNAYNSTADMIKRNGDRWQMVCDGGFLREPIFETTETMLSHYRVISGPLTPLQWRMIMADTKADFTKDAIIYLGQGICVRAVCAPNSWSPEQVSEEVTMVSPPGTSLNKWEIMEPREREDDFNNTNCIPCPDCEDRQHWLLNC